MKEVQTKRLDCLGFMSSVCFFVRLVVIITSNGSQL